MASNESDVGEWIAATSRQRSDMNAGMLAGWHDLALGLRPRPACPEIAGLHRGGHLIGHPRIVDLDRGAGGAKAEMRGEEGDFRLLAIGIDGAQRLPERTVVTLDRRHAGRAVALGRRAGKDQQTGRKTGRHYAASRSSEAAG